MVVAFANNQVIASSFDAGIAQITTDPMPTPGTHAQLSVNIHDLWVIGTGTPEIVVTLQGSDDGQEFNDVTGLSTTETAAGPATPVNAAIRSAYVRMKATCRVVSGTSGSFALGIFDAHVNFTTA